MAQSTIVLELDADAQARLRAALERGAFDYRSVDHAHFCARGEGVVATLYRSGRLVIQGAEAELFAVRYVGDGARSGGAPKPRRAQDPLGVDATRPLVGCDEAGKGDYFGPLVAAAVRLEPGMRDEVVAAGVADSKRLTDDTVRRLAGWIEGRLDFAIEVLDPPEYNRRWAELRNLNELLADLHATCIRRVARSSDAVLVDRFASESLLDRRLAGAGLRLRQLPRAEAEPAVAAASVLARASYLDRLAALSEETACDLHKGAGAPTDRSARRYVELHGFDALERVAKLHFKNTLKVRRG